MRNASKKYHFLTYPSILVGIADHESSKLDQKILRRENRIKLNLKNLNNSPAIAGDFFCLTSVVIYIILRALEIL